MCMQTKSKKRGRAKRKAGKETDVYSVQSDPQIIRNETVKRAVKPQ